MAIKNEWYLVSSRGAVLFYIAANPDCTVGDVAEGMSLTRRTVWGIIGDLRRAGMLHVRKEGRRHHHTVNFDAPLRLPFIKSCTLGTIAGELSERANRRR